MVLLKKEYGVDIVNTIDSGMHYMFRVYSYYHISNSDIKISIK